MIGVGVRNSTSDLLIANCDEFIFYDDLVRPREERKRAPKKAAAAAATKTPRGKPKAEAAEDDKEDRKQEAIDLILETVEALIAERGAGEQIWGSMVKQALKRRKPGFTESAYGFRSFSEALTEAQKRDLLKLQYDDKSGGYLLSIV